MLAEQHYLRSPLRPFSDMDPHNNNLTLEEKALLAARSQLFLRAAAAAAGPYAPLMGPMWAGASNPGLQSVGIPSGMLWSQWACLGPSLLAAQQQQAHHLAAAAAAAAAPHTLSLPRPMYPSAMSSSSSTLSQHRFSPYSPSPPARRSPPPSSPDSCPEQGASSPHPT